MQNHLELVALQSVTEQLNSLVNRFSHGLRTVGWREASMLYYLIIKQVVGVEKGKVRACLNQFDHLLVFFSLHGSHESVSNHDVGPKWGKHLVVDGCVEGLQELALLFFFFELVISCDVGEIQHLAFVIVEGDADPFYKEDLVVTSLSAWIQHLVHLHSDDFFPLK